VKFLFKQFGAAICVANIFGGVAARPEMEADGAALETFAFPVAGAAAIS